jgi:hypothetical protein
LHSHVPPPAPSHNPLILVLAGFGGAAVLCIVVFAAYLAGRAHTGTPTPTNNTETRPAALQSSKDSVAPTVATGTAPPTPVQAAADERVLTSATHGQAYPQPLLFHYAHVGGAGIADVHGQLDHRDGHYFFLGPGDSLTVEAPEGFEFVSDGTAATFDLEIEVHPHSGASHDYEVDVSHAHLDVNGPWVVLGHGEAHEWDLDHVNQRVARYVRIRNLAGAQPLYLDGVYVRRMQACADLARCRDVNHAVRPR